MDWLENVLKYGPTNLDNRVSKMFKISINIIMKFIKNLKVEIPAGVQILAEVKI